MIGVVVDRGSGPEGVQVAARLTPLLAGTEYRALSGTVFIGSGSADLITPHHERPHVLMPLTGPTWTDPLVRAQVTAADALVLVDHEELRRLSPHVGSAAVIVLEPPQHAGVIRSETPREATEVDVFARECPDLFASLTRLGVSPAPFDYRRVAEAVAEACAATEVTGAAT